MKRRHARVSRQIAAAFVVIRSVILLPVVSRNSPIRVDK